LPAPFRSGEQTFAVASIYRDLDSLKAEAEMEGIAEATG
jgi:hypothetical protein